MTSLDHRLLEPSCLAFSSIPAEFVRSCTLGLIDSLKHEEVLSLQPMICSHPNVLTFPPLSGGCSAGLDVFRLVFKQENCES